MNPSSILIGSAGVAKFAAFPEKIIPPIDIAVANGIFITKLNTIKNFKLGFPISLPSQYYN